MIIIIFWGKVLHNISHHIQLVYAKDNRASAISGLGLF